MGDVIREEYKKRFVSYRQILTKFNLQVFMQWLKTAIHYVTIVDNKRRKTRKTF